MNFLKKKKNSWMKSSRMKIGKVVSRSTIGIGIGKRMTKKPIEGVRNTAISVARLAVGIFFTCR